MPWFCAHAILYVKFKDGNQDTYPIWENVYLVEAADEKEAWQRAIQIAARAEGDHNGTFRWEDRPAEWVFAGIRKVLSVSHEGEAGKLASGDELSYSELTAVDLAAMQQLVAGEAVNVEYTE